MRPGSTAFDRESKWDGLDEFSLQQYGFASDSIVVVRSSSTGGFSVLARPAQPQVIGSISMSGAKPGWSDQPRGSRTW
jgi:hypothetical protein